MASAAGGSEEQPTMNKKGGKGQKFARFAGFVILSVAVGACLLLQNHTAGVTDSARSNIMNRASSGWKDLKTVVLAGTMKRTTTTSAVRGKDDDEMSLLFQAYQLSLWENQSLTTATTNQTCSPPPNAPKCCCLGETEYWEVADTGERRGGYTFEEWRTLRCRAFTPELHERFISYTREYMKRLPTTTSIVDSSTSSRYHQQLGDTSTVTNATTTTQRHQELQNTLRLTPFCTEHPDDDICLMMQQLFRHQWTLCFFGDSLSQQQYWGLRCALIQRGFGATFKDQGQIWAAAPLKERPTSPGYLNVNAMDVTVGDGNNYTQPRGITIIYNRHLRLNKDEQRPAGVLFCIERYDIFVFDFGVHHHHDLDDYSDTMANMIRSIHQHRAQTNRLQLKALVWRETTMQHFATRDGLYVDEEVAKDIENRQCVPAPLPDSYDTTNPRHRVTDDVILPNGTRTSHLLALERAARLNQMRFLNAFDLPPAAAAFNNASSQHDVAAKTKLTELLYVPMRSFQAPWPELHRARGDCTHFCHTPYFWLPLWRGLRLIVDRTVAQHAAATTQG